MGKSCTKGEFSIATFDYRSVNRPAHRQAARKCGVRSLRSLRWKCWWGDGWAVSDADNFYFLKMFAGLVSGLGGPMGTHGDPHLGRKVKQQHPKLAILRWIIMQQIGLGHPSLRRAHFMPMMNCWWKGRLKGKSILKGIILHSWRGLPQKDRKIQKQLEEDQAKPSVQCWIAYPEQQSQENSVSSGIKGYCGWVWRILLVSFCCSLFFCFWAFLDLWRVPRRSSHACAWNDLCVWQSRCAFDHRKGHSVWVNNLQLRGSTLVPSHWTWLMLSNDLGTWEILLDLRSNILVTCHALTLLISQSVAILMVKKGQTPSLWVSRWVVYGIGSVQEHWKACSYKRSRQMHSFRLSPNTSKYTYTHIQTARDWVNEKVYQIICTYNII